MERKEVTRAAAQADEAENQLSLLQQRFNEEKEAARVKVAELEKLLQAAESTQSAQIDDLQFRLEEETILRSELEVIQPDSNTKTLCTLEKTILFRPSKRSTRKRRRSGPARWSSWRKRHNGLLKQKSWPLAIRMSWTL